MRNKKLNRLQKQAETAFGELSTYLNHLNARETDASYVHARMLFDDGWRLNGIESHVMKTTSYVLWYDTDGDTDDTEGPSPSPVAAVASKESNGPDVLKALQLSAIPSSTEVVKFLMELTDEAGDYPDSNTLQSL